MSIELKPHNEETYIKVKEKFQTSNKVAVIHPTGTGILKKIINFIKKYSIKKTLTYQSMTVNI